MECFRACYSTIVLLACSGGESRCNHLKDEAIMEERDETRNASFGGYR